MKKMNRYIAISCLGFAFATAASAEDSMSPRLYAPEALKSRLGWIAGEILEQADMNVILVTDDEIPVAVKTMVQETKDKYFALRAAGVSLVNTRENKELSALESSAVSAGAAFLDDYFAGLLGARLTNDMEDTFISIVLGPGFASNTEDEKGVSYCLIRLPGTEWDPETLASYVTWRKSNGRSVAQVPGGWRDWVAYIAFHEATHCNKQLGGSDIRDRMPEWSKDGTYNTVANTLSEEIEADQEAFRHYEELLSAGYLLDPAVPRAAIALRALSSLLKNGYDTNPMPRQNDHATNPALSLGGEQPAWKGNIFDPDGMEQLLGGLNEASVSSTLLVARVMADSVFAGQSGGLEATTSICTNHTMGMLGFQYCFSVPVTIAPADFGNSLYHTMRFGHHLAHENPALRYAALKAMEEKGYFTAGSIAQIYVSQFLEAAADLAPDMIDPVLLERFRSYLAERPEMLDNVRRDTPYAATAYDNCVNGYFYKLAAGDIEYVCYTVESPRPFPAPF